MRLHHAVCRVHGKSLKRSSCLTCNAAYMRAYWRRQRELRPAKELWSRARKRAAKLQVVFQLPPNSIVIPPLCPALGIPLVCGGGRKATSPSLDRIEPDKGYTPDNVRVISDRANRLKGKYTLAELQERAKVATPDLREDYQKIAAYVARELLRISAKKNVVLHRSPVSDWRRVADLLEQVCQSGALAQTPALNCHLPAC